MDSCICKIKVIFVYLDILIEPRNSGKYEETATT
jgi:hypothetical protein